MRRKNFSAGVARNVSKRPSGRGPAACRLRLEPLESRQLLSAVPWTIDSGASTLSIAIPDQPIILDGTEAIVRVRIQSDGNSGPWKISDTLTNRPTNLCHCR